jgi:DNA-binding response OmpR family regulator/GAF domain-containing protein
MSNVHRESKSPQIEILIVEDSPTQAEHLRNILEQNAYRVLIARHGREALALLSRHRPTLVISDILMPEMDGYELCRRIKADENLKDIPVILLTALSDPTDVLKALECGASNFITKPYDKKYLLARIHYILANMELRKSTVVQMGINVFFANHTYFINAERLQILDLLLSTYETAVQENLELIKTRDELKALNEHLEEKVAERTAALTTEILERIRMEKKLRQQNEYLTALHETTLALINRLDLADLLEAITVRAAALMGTPHGYIYLVESEGTEMTEKVGIGAFSNFIGYRLKYGEGLAGKVWQTGQPLKVEDYRTWSGQVLNPEFHIFRALVGVPLKSGQQVIGVIGLARVEEGQRFEEEEVELLSRFAELASIALDNARLYTAAQQELAERKRAEEALATRARQQAVVATLGQLALAGTDLQQLFDQTVTMVATTLGTEYCEVLELLSDGNALKLVAGVGWKEGLVGQLTIGMNHSSQAGFTLLRKEPLIIEDLQAETRFSDPLLQDHGIISGVSVIIGNLEEPFGVLSAHTTRRRMFSQDDVHFFQSIANVLAEAIQRK